jgi:chromosome segregation ATPase
VTSEQQWVLIAAATAPALSGLGYALLKVFRFFTRIPKELDRLSREVNALKDQVQNVEDEQRQAELRYDKQNELYREERARCNEDVQSLRENGREQSRALNWLSKSVHELSKRLGTHLEPPPIVSEDE